MFEIFTTITFFIDVVFLVKNLHDNLIDDEHDFVDVEYVVSNYDLDDRCFENDSRNVFKSRILEASDFKRM